MFNVTSGVIFRLERLFEIVQMLLRRTLRRLNNRVVVPPLIDGKNKFIQLSLGNFLVAGEGNTTFDTIDVSIPGIPLLGLARLLVTRFQKENRENEIEMTPPFKTRIPSGTNTANLQ